MTIPVSLIVAMGRNRVIGVAGDLPWRLPGDLKRFKQLTLGKPMLMGRKTFESIGRPLPGRTNIVITRDVGWRADGVEVEHTVEAALEHARAVAAVSGADEIMVIGGAEIYAQTLAVADMIYITEVEAEPPGDAYFPELDPEHWHAVAEEPGAPADGDRPAYGFRTLERA